MTQLAAQAGETAEEDCIQASFALLREFGQQPKRATEFKEESNAGMLAAFFV